MTNHERMNKKMDEKMEKTTKKTTKAAKSAPAAKDEKMSIEEKKAKLQEKLQELLALAKKKKNSLEYQEISEFFKDMELDAIRKEVQENPPDVIVHFEQYAEILQKLVDESGCDILLVSRKAPVRDQNYNGYYFDFPTERMGRTAVDMLESLLAGEKSLPVRTIEAELKTRNKN